MVQVDKTGMHVFRLFFSRIIQTIFYDEGGGVAARLFNLYCFLKNYPNFVLYKLSACYIWSARELHRERGVKWHVTLASRQSARCWFQASHQSGHTAGISCQVVAYLSFRLSTLSACRWKVEHLRWKIPPLTTYSAGMILAEKRQGTFGVWLLNRSSKAY